MAKLLLGKLARAYLPSGPDLLGRFGIMGVPKRHHFVPQMILKNFTDENGYLHVVRKTDSERKEFRQKPSNSFFQGNLYTQTEGDGNVSLETEMFLSSLECKADGVFSKVLSSVRSGKAVDLSDDDLVTAYCFMYVQWKRVPDFQNEFHSFENTSALYSNVIDETKKRFPDRIDEIERIENGKEAQRIIKNAIVSSVEKIGESALRVFCKRGMSILKTSDKKSSYIIGSQPVVKLGPRNGYNLEDLNSEVWLPIAPDIAIGVGNANDRISVYEVKGWRGVRVINTSISNQSSIIASHSAPLVRSLACPR